MDTITALARVLQRDHSDIILEEGPARLEAQIRVHVPVFDGMLSVTAERSALDAMLRNEAEILHRWWPDHPAELALAELLSVHLSETIATLRPGELRVRLGEEYERPGVASEESVDGGTAFAPRSGARYKRPHRKHH